MAVTFGDRTRMTTATTGTGAVTLGSAVVKHQSFAAAGIANGDTVDYVIEDGNAWEIGYGTYTSAGTSLSRTLVASSTASLLSLTGAAEVFVSPNAAKYFNTLKVDPVTQEVGLPSQGVINFSSGGGLAQIKQTAGGGFQFNVSGSTALEISSVGIFSILGGPFASAQFEVNSGANVSWAVNRWTNATSGATALLQKSRSATFGTQTIVQSGDTVGALSFQGSDGATFQQGASVVAVVDAAPAAGSMPLRLSLRTSPSGTVSAVERLRIDAPGNIILGTAALATTATDGFFYEQSCAGVPTGVPTAYTGRVPIVVDTTNSKLMGYISGAWANLSGAGGGTPGGSAGNVQYNLSGTTFAGMSGTSWDDTNRSLTMTGATVTTSNPVLNMTQTWNNAATTFTGLKLNIINTASVASSPLFDVQVGSLSALKIDTGALVTIGAGVGTARINLTIPTNYIQASGGYTILDGGTGCAIRVNGSNIVLVQASQLQIADNAYSLGWSDLFMSRPAAATLQFGAADVAAPVAQTISVQSVVAGTAGNIAGTDWKFIASKGVGSGIGGSIIFQVAAASSGGGGTAQNIPTTALTIDSTKTITTASTIKCNGHLDMVNPGGLIYLADDPNIGLNGDGLLVSLRSGNGGGLSIGGSGTADAFLRSPAAATWQLGKYDAAAAVAQTISVQSVVAGTANGTAGADWIFKASSGTGTGTGGNIILKTPFSAKSSGTGQGTWVDRDIYVSKGKVLTSATPVSLFEIALPAGAMAGGTIYATIICTNGTDMQSFSQSVSYSVVNKAGVYTKSITAATGDKSVTGSSTLTTTWSLLDGTNKSIVQVSATTSLTPSTNAFICYYSMANNSEQATTIL